MKTSVVRFTTVQAIDFIPWKTQGIICVLLDVDSTITPWLGTAVVPEIIQALQQARSTGIQHIGLVTNSNRRNEARIRALAEQCGADSYFLPRRFRERKPRPALIRYAMDHFAVTPEQTAMIGDKFSADVIAARRAGITLVAWVDPLGPTDHPFDRLVRRPLERIIKLRYRP